MGSKILPQALVMLPRKPTQCAAPRNFGFSATFNRGSSLFNSSRVSVNRGLSNSNIDSVVSALARQRFVAGAEPEDSAGGEVAEENVEVEQETEEDDAVKAEETPKEPRKPIIKLGDDEQCF